MFHLLIKVIAGVLGNSVSSWITFEVDARVHRNIDYLFIDIVLTRDMQVLLV